MELLFIGVACTDEAINESNRKYYNNLGQVRPQQYFDFNLVTGLSNDCKVTALSNPPVATYPKSNCLIYKRKNEIISNRLTIKYIPLINLPIIKTFILMFYILFEVLKFYRKNRNENPTILLGYISFYSSIPVLFAARLLKIKVFVVVPDVPKYIGTYSNLLNPVKKWINNSITKIERYIEYRFDGYIFLTKAMNELINRKNRPYIVIEGMIKKEDFQTEKKEKYNNPKIIMYAGTLHKKFGIKKLVNSFLLSGIDDYELWIFGTGDYESELNEVVKKHDKIKFHGAKKRSIILDISRKAMLLVNPRPSSEEFTKYSFPSKTLEYMASGTPLISTQLEGIPSEYFKYIYVFDIENENEMAKVLFEIVSKTNSELENFGEKARDFVLNQKNNKIQSKKIINFIKLY